MQFGRRHTLWLWFLMLPMLAAVPGDARTVWERTDPAEAADHDMAVRSLASFLTYRVTSGRKDADGIIKEYLKVLCGSEEPGRKGTELALRINLSTVDTLLPMERWSGALTVGCGCFFDEQGTEYCGDHWDFPGIWR